MYKRQVNYAADYVMDVLDDFIGAVDVDVTVLTTIDSKLQSSAETTLVDAPVSYTHLDVYKRQLLTIAPPVSATLRRLSLIHI